jgi:hypothetical protein
VDQQRLQHIRNHYTKYGAVSPETAVHHIRELLDHIDDTTTHHVHCSCTPCQQQEKDHQ